MVTGGGAHHLQQTHTKKYLSSIYSSTGIILPNKSAAAVLYLYVVVVVVDSHIQRIVLCVCVFSSHPFWTSSSLDVPAGVTQEEGHTGFLIHLLPSAVRALIFVARRIQPFLSLVDREVEFCVLTN